MIEGSFEANYLDMQTYVDQLLNDIEKAKRKDQPWICAEKPSSFEEEMAEIERWLENDPAFTFSYYCGLRKEEFPPAEKLTDDQIHKLKKQFEDLLYTWNLSANIPEEIPPSKAYTLLVSVLDKKVDIPDTGFMTFEFCAYDPPTCPLDEYCECREFYDSYNPDHDEDLMNKDEGLAGEN